MAAETRGPTPEKDPVRGIALFFLFALMDEKVALEASQKTIAHLKALKGRTFTDASGDNGVNGSDIGDAQLEVQLIYALGKGYDHYRKSVPRNRSAAPPMNLWKLDSQTEIGPWARFQKEATEVEVLAVIFSKVLGFKESAIAEGLNLSAGTVHYRIGKGVRHLGQITRQAAMAKKA